MQITNEIPNTQNNYRQWLRFTSDRNRKIMCKSEKQSSLYLMRGFVAIFALIWGVLFIDGLIEYSGTKLTYGFFSVSFLILLLSGFYRQVTYGYLFLVIFLWLGFWLKFTVHLIFPYPFGEPIGQFVGSVTSWNEVLATSTIASIGVLVGRGFVLGGRSVFVNSRAFIPPKWYSAVRWRLWLALIISILVISTLNAIYGIQQSGLVPRTILGWHLNGTVYYLLAAVFSICVATLAWWDASLKRNLTISVVAVLAEGFVSTVSLLSRGVLIFHAMPQLLALFKNRELLTGYTKFKAMVVGLVFIGLILFSFSAVNMLRDHYYSGVAFDYSLGFESQTEDIQAAGGLRSKFLRFAVDRWVGLEGVMATSAYPTKSESLFLQGLTERSENGRGTMYQDICSAHYAKMDMSKFRFASLPGAAAFFFYSGNLWVVFFGMLFFSWLLIYAELSAFKLTQNPILVGLLGCSLASTISQFGVTPSNLIPYVLVLIGSTLMIGAIQSKKMEQSIRDLRLGGK